MSENNFSETMESLFKGMDAFISSKTVIGDAVKFDDGTIVLPLVDVSFGVAAGAFANASDKKNNGGGGLGGKIQPSAVIVIKDGKSKLVNIKNQFLLTKLLDMAPDIMDRFGGGDDKKKDKDNKSEDKQDSGDSVIEETADGDVVIHES